MDTLLEALRRDYPDLLFIAGDTCCWSPKQKSITYQVDSDPENAWGALHELGHALLKHTDYKNDADLLQKELAAWQKARSLAEFYGLTINEEHIESCLDSYRDWLNKRSTCPVCSMKATATSATTYRCFNCHATWRVSSARHHRPYRLQPKKEKLPE